MEEEGKENPFQKVAKLARTPPGKPPCVQIDSPATSMVNLLYLDNESAKESNVTESEDQGDWTQAKSKSQKRKKLSVTPDKESAPKQYKTHSQTSFKEIYTMAKDLDEMTRVRYTNTKVEIKHLSEKLRHKIKRFGEQQQDDTKSKESAEEIEKLKKENSELRTEVDRLLEKINKLENERNVMPIEEFRKAKAAISSDSDVENLVSRNWPKEAFKYTKTCPKSIVAQAKTKIIIVSEENKKDQEVLKRLSSAYPALNKRIERAPRGKPIHLRINEEMSDDEEDQGESEDLRKQELVLIKSQPNDLKSIIRATKTAVNKLEVKTEKATFFVTHDIDVSMALKVVECSLAGVELTAELCAKGRGAKKRTRDPAQALSTLIIKNANGKTYADTVKELKSSINPTDQGVTIKKVARTKDGSVLMKFTEESKGAGGKLQQEINNATGSNAELKKDNTIQIIIHDLDGVTKVEEIEGKIREQTEEIGDITVKEPVPTRNGAWTATVRLPKRSGEALIRERTIKIGWLSCRITAKVNIPFCSNCLRLGHVEAACEEAKEADKKCYKCTRKGHEAKDCQNEPMCKTCNKTGHQAVSYECPAYKKLTTEKRAQNKARLEKLLEQ